MKKLITLAAGIILMFSGGCTVEKIKVVTQEEVDKINKKTSVYRLKLVEIQGCEYWEYLASHNCAHVTHKGNCKYCIERSLNLNK